MFDSRSARETARAWDTPGSETTKPDAVDAADNIASPAKICNRIPVVVAMTYQPSYKIPGAGQAQKTQGCLSYALGTRVMREFKGKRRREESICAPRNS